MLSRSQPHLLALALIPLALACSDPGGSPSTGSGNDVKVIAPAPNVQPPSDGGRVQLLHEGDCWGDEFVDGIAIQAPAKDGDGTIAPKLVAEGRPVYPSESRKDREQGLVLVDALVGPDGNVIRACVGRGVTTRLNTAAVEAARRCRFEPGSVDGTPAAMWVQLPYNFKL